MNSIICDAIARRSLVSFDYHGRSRVVEMYSHGFNANRVEVVRAYQVAGESTRSVAIGWKFFIVAEMDDLLITSQKYTTDRAGQTEVADGLIVIHCRVA